MAMEVTSYYKSFWWATEVTKTSSCSQKRCFSLAERPGLGVHPQTKLIIDFPQSNHSIINLVLYLNCITILQYYIINSLFGNQYSKTSITRIIPFLEKLEVRIYPSNFPSWLTPPSWFLHTTEIYQGLWQYFSNFIATTPHSAHIHKYLCLPLCQ